MGYRPWAIVPAETDVPLMTHAMDQQSSLYCSFFSNLCAPAPLCQKCEFPGSQGS